MMSLKMGEFVIRYRITNDRILNFLIDLAKIHLRFALFSGSNNVKEMTANYFRSKLITITL